MEKVYTTGDIAKICKVAPRTVTKWIDSRELPGYRLPGSSERRVTRKNLINFMRQNKMPMDNLEQETWHKILLVCVEDWIAQRIKALLPEAEDYRYQVALTSFEAGLMVSSFHPDILVLDFSLGRSESLRIASCLQSRQTVNVMTLVALANEDEGDILHLIASGFSKVFQKPFDYMVLVNYMQSKIKMKA